MKTNKLFLFFAILLAYTSSTGAQVKINHRHFINLFNTGNYIQLYNEAREIRLSKEYGKNWAVDYYLAIALCGGKMCRDAERGFSYIENEYPLNPKQKELIIAGRKFCAQEGPSSQSSIQYANLISNISGLDGYPLATVSGKIGWINDHYKNAEYFRLDDMLDQSDLEKRLFEVSKKKEALDYYKVLLPEGSYSIDTLGRFVLITMVPKYPDNKDLRDAALELENVCQFYIDHYSVRPTNFLIAVYLMGSPEAVKKVAAVVHRINIPSYIYGYSCLADMSLLGNSSKTGLGTIKHEMFHLIVRADLGDIPGWLDEGIACMYEESHWEGKVLTYDSNVWRTNVLRQSSRNGNPLPLLGTMINNNWDEFSQDSTTTAAELSVNYAVAKHFAMFLETSKQLSKVVDAYRNRKNIFVDTTSVDLSSVQILENVMSMNLPEIQKDFDNWLKVRYDVSANRSRDEILRRISVLDEVLKHMCIDHHGYSSFMEEFETLIGELRNSESDVSDDLTARCIKFIAKGERLYIECNR